MKINFFFIVFLLLVLISGCLKENKTDQGGIKKGDVVEKHGEIKNLEKFNEFIKNVNNGRKDKIRIVVYTIEGDPIFYTLNYDSKKINYTFDDSKDRYGGAGTQTTTCSKIESMKTENGLKYYLSKCSSKTSNSFDFRVPK